MKAFGSVYGCIMQSGLEDVLVELVYLRVSQINGCAYCLDMHTRDLSKKGLPLQKLALVQTWHEAGDLFSEREQAALAWAESVTRVADTRVPDETFDAITAPSTTTPITPAFRTRDPSAPRPSTACVRPC